MDRQHIRNVTLSKHFARLALEPYININPKTKAFRIIISLNQSKIILVFVPKSFDFQNFSTQSNNYLKTAYSGKFIPFRQLITQTHFKEHLTYITRNFIEHVIVSARRRAPGPDVGAQHTDDGKTLIHYQENHTRRQRAYAEVPEKVSSTIDAPYICTLYSQLRQFIIGAGMDQKF